VRRGAASLMGELSRSAVRQGTLHPPTATMLDEKAALEAQLNKITGGR